MKPVSKVRGTRKRRQTRRKVIIVSGLVLLAGLFAVVYFSSSGDNVARGFQEFTDHYLGIMKSLNSSQTKLNMASELDQNYNFTDLFAWEHGKLTFTQDLSTWLEDPIEILQSGRGICVQFSIVYVSACLALGHQARLVVAANSTSWTFIHVWAEAYFNSSWVHVDPSDQVWNEPSRYQDWTWGKNIGHDVKIYAFEDEKSEEVTSTYTGHTS
jgi:hypothetical protein